MVLAKIVIGWLGFLNIDHRLEEATDQDLLV